MCSFQYYVQCFIKIWQLPPFDCLDDLNVVILKMIKTWYFTFFCITGIYCNSLCNKIVYINPSHQKISSVEQSSGYLRMSLYLTVKSIWIVEV